MEPRRWRAFPKSVRSDSNVISVLLYSAALSFAGTVKELQFVYSVRKLVTAAEARGLDTICPGLTGT
jgi:hypothetical protein